MDGTEIKLSIVETKDREISIINEEWLQDRFLLWPPNNLLKKSQKILLKSRSADNWTKISDFKILQRGIGSIEEANERLIFYTMYENTLDKIQDDMAKALEREHPLGNMENNQWNYNSMFDELVESSYTTSTPKTCAENLVCDLCGKPCLMNELIECLACAQKCCSGCDEMYHKHPKRAHHTRRALILAPEYPVARKTTSNVNDVRVLADSTVNKKINSGCPVKNNGVIPKPSKKTIVRRVDKNQDRFVKTTDVVGAISIKCSVCGIAADIKCSNCLDFCNVCDKIFHQHPERGHHIRRVLKLAPEHPAARKTTSNVNDVRVLTDPTVNKKIDSGCPVKNNGVIPKPSKKTIVRRVDKYQDRFAKTTDVVESIPPQDLPVSPKQSLSRSFIMDLPVVFAESLSGIDKAIINLDECYDDQLTDLQLPSTHILPQTTEIRTLSTNLNKPVKPKNTAVKGRKMGAKGVAIKRISSTLSKVHKDVRVMTIMLKKVKTEQMALKHNLNAFKTEITHLAEIVNKSKENEKKKIVLDESFIMPGLPIKSIVAARMLHENCSKATYCDQVAVRFMNLTSESVKDIGAATKRVMEYMFSYDVLMLFSWTGQSSLNSGLNQKENFSELSGIITVVRQAATLNLLDTEKVREASLKAVKEVVRRASQNYQRQNAQ